jgi:hypothetical protein
MIMSDDYEFISSVRMQDTPVWPRPFLGKFQPPGKIGSYTTAFLSIFYTLYNNHWLLNKYKISFKCDTFPSNEWVNWNVSTEKKLKQYSFGYKARQKSINEWIIHVIA